MDKYAKKLSNEVLRLLSFVEKKKSLTFTVISVK